MIENIEKENTETIKCHDCEAMPGELHKKGCDWEICRVCGTQLLSCFCPTEGIQRIPYGTVREIAARIPGYSSDHIEKYIKKDLIRAINNGLW